MAAPLRKVVHRTFYSRDSASDHLECGHTLHTPSDRRGLRFPVRRRCTKCQKIAEGTHIPCPACNGEWRHPTASVCKKCWGYCLVKKGG